ncbi:YrzI family small protein [Oceanobacillus piezotolerans]|uniref:YrzI family small protein n=1 Tax=Oceanobacillus piezotolerans TaxID=2448030 RepID=A0A498DIN1_9BACI|nr:YrzI family small protein [Oceanobacillus piezotolerans]RLL48429.1 YrzI family small protein [Oceanobacillus piezotolerans]
MRLNIFFLTITITKRENTLEEALHNENVERIFEESRRRADYYNRQY